MERIRILQETQTEKAQKSVFEKLRRARLSWGKVGFVAGPVTSDHLLRFPINAVNLAKFEQQMRREYDFPIYSVLDFLPQELSLRLGRRKASGTQGYWDADPHGNHAFWEDIFETGVITDLFLAPNWEHSMPSIVDFNLARQLNMTIHNIPDNMQKTLPSESS